MQSWFIEKRFFSSHGNELVSRAHIYELSGFAQDLFRQMQWSTRKWRFGIVLCNSVGKKSGLGAWDNEKKC